MWGIYIIFPTCPNNLWLYSKCSHAILLQQKMSMAKNGFNTTTVWSAGNSEAFKVYTHRVGAFHPMHMCTFNFWRCTKVHSDGLTQIPAIIEVHYKYIHKKCLYTSNIKLVHLLGTIILTLLWWIGYIHAILLCVINIVNGRLYI